MHSYSYFSCPANCGIFVSFDKLRLCHDESEFAKRAMEACRGSAERLWKATEKQRRHQMQTRSKAQKQKEEKIQATVGSRVQFFSDSCQTFEGTIRWIGDAYYSVPGQSGQTLKRIVGIEAVSARSKDKIDAILICFLGFTVCCSCWLKFNVTSEADTV